MPFVTALRELCQRCPGARGAVFVDDEGESVQRYVSSGEVTSYDLDVAGAHIPPLLMDAVPWAVLRVRGEDGHALASVVHEHYVVVLLLDGTADLVAACRALREATVALRAEM